METTPRDLDDLLAHSGWARALARSLVRDSGQADDLVQRAWLAALRRPPQGDTPPRRWIASVMRNFVRQDAREAGRRETRERAVARSESASRSAAVDDAAALQVRLIAAVRELPEPSRSTVWARYYDGLAPRDIAKRDGVPVDTVKTRLARGLDMLRKRFDREHGGDRNAWMLAFLPLADAPLFSASTIGVLAMGAKWKLAVALVLAASAGTWFVVENKKPASPSSLASSPPAVAPDLAQAVDPMRSLESVPEQTARVPIAETDALAVERVRSDSLLHGRVLDLERRPVAGLAIGPAKNLDATNTFSAEDGTFEIQREYAGVALEARGDGWATVWVDRIPRVGIDRRVTILVARAGKLSGLVLDRLGQPAPGVSVDVSLGVSAQRNLANVIGADPHQIGYATLSDADGRFDLGEVPLVAGTILASLDGRDAPTIPIPTQARDDLVIAFDPPAFDDIVVRGSVGSAPNMRTPGAYVRIGNATQRTASDGSFALLVWPQDLRDGGPQLELVAASENQTPTRVAFTSPRDLRDRAASETFDLVLGNDPLSIWGRIVDMAGDPLPTARVRLDEEWFGSVTAQASGKPRRLAQSVEAIVRGEPNSGADFRKDRDTDEFSISGLQDRDYRLVATCIDPPAIRVIENVRPQSDELVVVLDTGGPELRIAGHVVDRAGKPMADTEVNADLDLGAGTLTSRSVTTNSEGAFELTRLRGRVLQVFADLGSRRVGVDVKPGDPLDDVRIVVPRELAIQVDITSKPAFATDFKVVNARGTVSLRSSRTIAAQTVSRGSERTAVRLPIHDGRSDVVTVDEDELTLVLLRDGLEVARIPIVFASGGVTILRP